MLKRIIEIIAILNQMPVEAINSETRFLEDLQLDSLNFLDFVTSIEKEFDVSIHPNDIEYIQTVGELEAYLQKVKSNGQIDA